MKYCLSEFGQFDRHLNGRILVAADFDGTLSPIAPTPGEAGLSAAMTQVLFRLNSCERVTLAVLSGRSLDDIRRRLPFEAICAGNHGLELAGPGLGPGFEHPAALEFQPVLLDACSALSKVTNEWPCAFVENKRLTATLHYRNVDPRCHYRIRLAARRCLSKFGPKLSLRSGRMALEICPKVEWDKGAALKLVQERLGPFDVCICMGDDRTDETMFRVNAGGLNIKVGYGFPSSATLFLWEPAETAILLEHIVDVVGAGPGDEGMSKTGATAAGITLNP